MTSAANTNVTQELINVSVDGKKISVPKGTNLIEAAKVAGVDVPYYCYHQHLSIAGNCRMCKVQVRGCPKLEIGCNTTVVEGMGILTQETSPEVKKTQQATLEFILINHPLDCTVCDQAGHCKLQDYHFEYNAQESRFLEEKEHKVKAEPLGPHVMLDGGRCIMCTRCIRFCDEITKTSELGMLNRGDRSVIAVAEGRPLDNPLSGTVVDLCPVGALTHRDWRFNTRIWFTKQTDSICPGCSTGCNVKVAVRDSEVVQVKARLNSDVNKEWLCDEGRYGFQRFLPKNRITNASIRGQKVDLDVALKEAAKIKGNELAIFVAGDLLLEEYVQIKKFIAKYAPQAQAVISYRERKLTSVEAILVSPDYAPNFKGAMYSGLVSDNLEQAYDNALAKVRAGTVTGILVVGDNAILAKDSDAGLLAGIAKAKISVAMLTDAENKLYSSVQVVLPARSILEKSGLMMNRASRLQYSAQVVPFPDGTEPSWRLMNNLAQNCGGKLTEAQDDRALTLNYLAEDNRLKGLTIAKIKVGGVTV